MKQKKTVRSDKSVDQQIEDLKRAIEKYGDYDGSRAKRLSKLLAEKDGVNSCGAVATLDDSYDEHAQHDEDSEYGDAMQAAGQVYRNK